MQIVPMRDLKNTVKIEQLCESENGPVFVTKNGYGKLVVMDIKYFEREMQNKFEFVDVQRGINDMNNGKVFDGATVLAGMREKYGFWVYL